MHTLNDIVPPDDTAKRDNAAAGQAGRHVIVLPNGRPVTVGSYVRAFRRLAAGPPGAWVNARDWDGFGTTAERVLRAMRDAMRDRINRHVPWYRKGRKWAWDWQRDVARVAWNLNAPRRIVTREREVPPEYRARLAHRLACDLE
jgi:hypothetical protein